MERKYHDREWLERQYHGEGLTQREMEGLTQREIGEECGVDPCTIRRWMKRLDIETREIKGENHGMWGKEPSEEVKQKISDSLTGRTFSEDTIRRMSEAQSGRTTPESVRQKISASLSGLTRSPETREKMSRSTAGEQNPNWRGGISRPNGAGWTIARDKVIRRDEICQHCGHDGSEHRLAVHHLIPVQVFRDSVDVDLEDAHDLDNLVLLCNPCHGKAEQGTIQVEPTS